MCHMRENTVCYCCMHQAEAEQLRAAAERALSDVKTGARAAISDMAQRHEQDLLAARAAAAEEVTFFE
jgi:hypothetical protein